MKQKFANSNVLLVTIAQEGQISGNLIIQFYFAHKYNNENALVYEENGEVLSALLMLPYPMKWQDTVIQTAYISGACTQEKARNQGFMTKLLQTAFHQMYKRKIALSTLIPAEKLAFRLL